MIPSKKPTYSKAQIIHSLSLASNTAFGKVFEDESTCQKSYDKLQSFVKEVSQKVLENDHIGGLIGKDWKTVWGPVVYSHDKNSSFAKADNTMGVYYSELQNLFVIAIAGTNSISSYGWTQEDFHVNKTAVWKDITGNKNSKGDISQGTATGLDVLIHKMKDNKTDFLTAIKKFPKGKITNKIEIAVTGHSLGGALSPALALYLSDTQAIWDPANSMKISTYPTAGPTIGVHKMDSMFPPEKQVSFTDYYEEQIKKGKIEYHGVKNSLDIVPLAWNKDDLAKIPNLYKSNGIKDASLGTASLIAVLNTLKSSKKLTEKAKQYVYKQIQPITTIKGKFNTSEDNDVSKLFNFFRNNSKRVDYVIPKSLQVNLDNLENISRFFVQAGFQHVEAYYELLKVEGFMVVYNGIAYPKKKNNELEMNMEMVNEAVGFDINSLLELSELSEEDLEN